MGKPSPGNIYFMYVLTFIYADKISSRIFLIVTRYGNSLKVSPDLNSLIRLINRVLPHLLMLVVFYSIYSTISLQGKYFQYLRCSWKDGGEYLLRAQWNIGCCHAISFCWALKWSLYEGKFKQKMESILEREVRNCY